MTFCLSYKETLNQTKNISSLSLDSIIRYIISDELQEICDDLRTCQDPTNKTKLKTQLPLFYPNCIFHENDLGARKNNIRQLTGLIQIDMDLKDNLNDGFSVSSFVEYMTSMPSCVYCFISPSGGVKAAIMTNLDVDDLDLNLHKSIACFVMDEIRSGFQVCLDGSVTSPTLACFCSHDPSAYHNKNAISLDVSHIKPYESKPVYKKRKYNTDQIEPTFELISKIVKYIPSRLPDTGGQGAQRKARYPYNQIVIDLLGLMGAELMASHWSASASYHDLVNEYGAYDNHGKTLNDLFAITYKYGCRRPTPPRSGRRVEKERKSPTIKCDITLPKLKLRGEMSALFQNILSENKNIICRVTLGAGKTFETIKFIEAESPRFIWVSPTKELADQSRADYETQRCKGMSDLQKKHTRPETIRFLSKEDSCRNAQALDSFNGLIPPAFCVKDCPMKLKCQYINQFSYQQAPIKGLFMTTQQLYNSMPYFLYHGVIKDAPRFKFNFSVVVIDENPVTDEVFAVTADSNNLVQEIVNSINGDDFLVDVLPSFKELILKEYRAMQRRKPVWNSSLSEWQNDTQNYCFDPILELMYHFVLDHPMVQDQSPLHHFDDESQTVRFIKKILREFTNKKRIILLDATAEPDVVAKIAPSVSFDFHEISIGRDKETNRNIVILDRRYRTSKAAFKDNSGSLELIAGEIKKYIGFGDPKDYGIITYKNYVGKLAKLCGVPIENCGNFGGVAGSNRFSRLNLFCVGQNNIFGDLTNLSFSLHGFECSADLTTDLKRHIIRKTDGEHEIIVTQNYSNQQISLTNRFFGMGPTEQAWGRFRELNCDGKGRKMVIFSSQIPPDTMEFDAILTGQDDRTPYCVNSRRKVVEFGVLADGGMVSSFAALGFDLWSLRVQTKNRKKKSVDVFLCRQQGIRRYLNDNNLKLLNKKIITT